MDLTDRNTLRRIRDNALSISKTPGLNQEWADAYKELTKAASKLDNLWERYAFNGKEVVTTYKETP